MWIGTGTLVGKRWRCHSRTCKFFHTHTNTTDSFIYRWQRKRMSERKSVYQQPPSLTHPNQHGPAAAETASSRIFHRGNHPPPINPEQESPVASLQSRGDPASLVSCPKAQVISTVEDPSREGLINCPGTIGCAVFPHYPDGAILGGHGGWINLERGLFSCRVCLGWLLHIGSTLEPLPSQDQDRVWFDGDDPLECGQQVEPTGKSLSIDKQWSWLEYSNSQSFSCLPQIGFLLLKKPMGSKLQLRQLRSWFHCDAIQHITLRGKRQNTAALDCLVFKALLGEFFYHFNMYLVDSNSKCLALFHCSDMVRQCRWVW